MAKDLPWWAVAVSWDLSTQDILVENSGIARQSRDEGSVEERLYCCVKSIECACVCLL